MSTVAQSLSCVTLGGVPLRFELEWPFHKSTSGADFHVLHGTAWLLSDAEQKLHAQFAANFSQTIVEILPSLQPEHATNVVINGVRMWADAGRMEFLKSGKRLPVEVSSRYLNFKNNQLRFLAAGPEELKEYLKKKLYWLGCRSASQPARVRIANACDCQYLGASAEALLQAAAALDAEGLSTLEGEFASPSAALEQQAELLSNDLRKVLEKAAAKFNATLTS